VRSIPGGGTDVVITIDRIGSGANEQKP
jgi:hypothetical protein